MNTSKAFALNIKALREDNGLTQAEFGETLGLGSGTISKWERGDIKRPHPPMVELICHDYSVTADDLLSSNGYYAKTRGIEGREPEPSETYLPAEDGGEQWCPPEYAREGNFYVRVKGDSMNKALMDGQYALVDIGSEVENGDIALVEVGGGEATIKRVKMVDGVAILEPDSTNPGHKRRVIDETDPDSPKVKMVGKVVYAVTRL